MATTLRETRRKYDLKNRERIREWDRQYKIRHAADLDYRSRKKKHERSWRVRNPLKVREISAKKRADKAHRTPKWLAMEHLEEIKNIYLNCPEGHEVDHIIPLRGKDISGLHVPWNLQYLTISENRSKSNHLIDDASVIVKTPSARR